MLSTSLPRHQARYHCRGFPIGDVSVNGLHRVCLSTGRDTWAQTLVYYGLSSVRYYQISSSGPSSGLYLPILPDEHRRGLWCGFVFNPSYAEPGREDSPDEPNLGESMRAQVQLRTQIGRGELDGSGLGPTGSSAVARRTRLPPAPAKSAAPQQSSRVAGAGTTTVVLTSCLLLVGTW